MSLERRLSAYMLILVLQLLGGDRTALSAEPEIPPSANQQGRANSSVALHVGQRHFEVTACSASIFQVTYRGDSSSLPTTPVLAPTPCSVYAQATVEESVQQIHLRTPRAVLSVEPTSLQLSLGRTNQEPMLIGTIPQFPNHLAFTHRPADVLYGGTGYYRGALENSGLQQIDAGNHGLTAAPFIWSTSGYGLLWDADGSEVEYASGRFNIRTKRQDGLRYYLIVGNPAEIFSAVAVISGRAPLPPKYTLGFMNSEWGITERELRKDISTYRAKGIPLDMYLLDYDWFGQGDHNWGDFAWKDQLFPNGASGRLLADLKQQGIRVATIRKPWLRPGTIQWQQANALGFIYSSCEVRTPCRDSDRPTKEFNFETAEARNWWWKHSQSLLFTGIAGYWNDEAELNRNFRTLQMQQTYYEGQRSVTNQRVWSLNRNFHLGAQRYGFASWSGDFESSFENMAAQRLYILGTINLGQPWVGMDSGGFKSVEWWLDVPHFQGKPTPENYAKWIQFSAFTPVFRVHGRRNQEREPWHFGEKAERAAKMAIELRYRLLPYLYSTARRVSVEGLPFIRPQFFDYPDDPKSQGLYSQWLVGDFLLTRPVVEEGAERVDVYLPAGEWIDYWTLKRHLGPTILNYAVDAENWTTIPLFIKDGGIVPIAPTIQHTGELPSSVQEILIFPSASETALTYYDDDGLTYDYEQGKFFAARIRAQEDKGKVQVTIDNREGMLPAPFERVLLRIHRRGSKLPATVRANGVTLPQLDSIIAKTTIEDGWSIVEKENAILVLVKVATEGTLAVTLHD